MKCFEFWNLFLFVCLVKNHNRTKMYDNNKSVGDRMNEFYFIFLFNEETNKHRHRHARHFENE